MKKIMIILLAILCIPVSSFAISLSTLENNPNRYLKVDEDSVNAMYLDTYSVKSIRYAPPYYTLSAQTYYVNYKYCMIASNSVIFNYDYNHSVKTTRKQIVLNMLQNNKTLTEDAIESNVENALRKDSGINLNYQLQDTWTLIGQKIKGQAGDHENIDISYDSQGYALAQNIFHSYYNQFF
ncbi:hypothetical protein SAMN02910343_00245 [Dialister histaminiformans]|uniref:Uncharacterized protein n=1 Tax=Allisonella histaminiformans TaxID=209880 RepID=A0A1G5V2C6_9FIRM|nr:hypothetical protein [Allisonella histaminiformans]SDA39155.1 hypothetical protein SAMN02910343_00245 [Allisonella histaminiformans]